MEKRFRDFIRHFEKIDFDVISEEEIWEEREKLQLRLNEVHQEMIRVLIPTAAFFLAGCGFLIAGFLGSFIGSYVCFGINGFMTCLFAYRYKLLLGVVKKLYFYADKLTN